MRSVPFALLLVLVSFGALAGCRGRTGSTASCTPGESLLIGCDSTVGRMCSGDPTLTICDASIVSDPESCSSGGAGFLAFDDDSGDDRCPRLTTICPASGRIAINPNPFSSSSSSWSCEYAIVRGGIGP